VKLTGNNQIVFRSWKSNVKVTGGHQGVECIQVDAGALKPIF